MSAIQDNVRRIVTGLPIGVELVAVGKGRTPEELLAAVEGGARIIGENYVQEAERARHVVGDRVTWHLIGHLQGNKIKHAATLFDMVETVDALHTATALDRRCADLAKVMSVLIEVNSGLEPGKSGALPEGVPSLARAVSVLPNLRLVGLMTMGPLVADAEEARSYFVLTRQLMESVRQLALPGVDMKYLSMGTTDTYMVAIEEGANLVRIGRGIFGER